MKKTIYLSDEEAEYAKSQGPAFIRSLVQKAMTGEAEAPRKPDPVVEARVAVRKLAPMESPRRVTGPTCKTCGALMLFGEKSCKFGHAQ